MKNNRQAWKRLTRTARHAPAPPVDVAPFGFATRVIAGWRSHRSANDWSIWEPLVRRALICSSLILLVTLAASYRTLQTESPDELSLAEAVIQMSFNQ